MGIQPVSYTHLDVYKRQEYSSGGFGLKEQKKLAELAGKLAGKGVPVLLSNHDTEFVRQIYRGAQLTSFKVRRFISCRGAVSYTHLLILPNSGSGELGIRLTAYSYPTGTAIPLVQ